MVALDEIQAKITKAQKEIEREGFVKPSILFEIQDAIYQCTELDNIRKNFADLILKALRDQTLHGAKPGPINVIEKMIEAGKLQPPSPPLPPVIPT